MITNKEIKRKHDTVKEKNVEEINLAISSDFITSPADVEGPRKADLQDYEVTEKELKLFKDLCDK